MMKQNHLTWRMLSLSIMMGLMCLMGNNAEAQVVCNDTVFPFLETFDGGVDSLVCWQPLEGSNWQLIQPGTGSGNGPNKSMVSSSEYANVDSWIVSKAIALPADTTVPLVLSWDVSATHYLTYYYRYFVLVSTGDWTDRTSYDTVYADSSMQVYCGNENTNFENRMVNLDAYHGQVIHVAFCNHPLYANYAEGHWMRLNIDNVEVRDGNAPRVALELPDHVYSGDSITYAATLIEGNTTGLTYTWHSTLLDTTITLNNNLVSINYPTTGIDTVTVIAANAYGADTATAVVEVLTHPLPQVSLPVPQQVMTDDTVVYTAVVNECSPYGLAFHWHSSLLDTTIALNNNLLSINYLAAGIDTVTVVVSNIDGADTATAVMEVLNCNGTMIPYVEDFNGVHATGAASADGELAPCWEGMTTGSNAAYAPHVINVNGYQFLGTLPSNALFMVAGSEAGYGSWEQVVLPRFNQPLHDLSIAFNYRFEAVSRGTLSVGYLDSTDTFVSVADMTPHAGSYRRDTVSLASVTDNNARLALRWGYNTSYYAVAIDNIEVFNPDTAIMQPVVALEVPDEVNIYDTVVYTAHLQQGDSASLTYTWHSSLLDTTITLNYNLLSINYPSIGVDTVTVTATNGYGSYTATAIVSVGNCNYRSVPYVDDFEGVPQGQMPECWTSRWTGSASNKPKATEYAYSWEEDMTIRMIAGNGSSYGDGLSTVVLPGFDQPLNQLSLALDYYNGAYYGTLTVGYLVDTVYTPLRTLPYNFSVDYEMMRDTIDFSSVMVPEARMAIRLINPSMWEAIYLDNIEVFLSSQIGAPPVVTLDGPAVATRYEPTLMTAHLLQGDTTGLTYRWHSSLLNQSSTAGNQWALVYNVVGIDTVTLIATNAFGSDTAMRIVTVGDNLNVGIRGSSTAYVGDTLHYSAVLAGDTTGLSYSWHSTLLDRTIATAGPMVTMVYNTIGTDTLTLTVVNARGPHVTQHVVNVLSCGIISTFPYSEDFEDYGWQNREACWLVRTPVGLLDNQWRRTNAGYGNSPYCMFSNGNSTNRAFEAWLITPAIELPAGANNIVFNLAVKLQYIDHFAVVVSPTGDPYYDAFTDTLYLATQSGYNTSWNTLNLSLLGYRGRHIRLAFVHYSSNGSMGGVRIDDLAINVEIPDTPPVMHTVNLFCDNAMGSVSGGGTYPDSTLVTLTATPHEGYLFDGWHDGDTANPRQVLVVSDTTFIALFRTAGDSVGINELRDNRYEIIVYPNPARGAVTVSVGAPATLTVLDLAGRVVVAPQSLGSSATLPLSDLPSGTYFLRVTTAEGTAVKKLIVK